jgi:RNA polymerase sigma-70 factor (ECF subfamily)
MPALHLADLDRGRAVAIPLATEDEAILAAAHAGATEQAAALLFDRYAEHVTRVLVRILGTMDEVEDLRQEALLRTLDRMHKVRSADALRGYVTGVTTFVARECLRRRRRRRWLRIVPPEDMPELTTDGDESCAEATRAVYDILDRLGEDDRTAFCLRIIDGMELTEVAAACGVSLATAKRRVVHAQERFFVHAAGHPALAAWSRSEAAHE